MWVLPVSAEETGFPFAQSIIKTQTVCLDDKTQSNTRYFISSKEASQQSAPRFGGLVRGHWDIENGSHRQRDTLWREDAQPMRHHGRAHVLASLRQLALGLLNGAMHPPQESAKKRPASHQLQLHNHDKSAAIARITGKR